MDNLDAGSIDRIEVGLDEAGRGPMMGPVVAGAVIWPPTIKSDPLIRDSKKLKPHQLLEAYDRVRETAIHWSIAQVENDEIDQINILQASLKAMKTAAYQIPLQVDHLMIDGNRFSSYRDSFGREIHYSTIVKGDDRYYSIAAASILAKVSRDRWIEDLCDREPELVELYDTRRNKGYGQVHIAKMQKYGISPWHRRSYKPCLGLSMAAPWAEE
jgi:ribonuclease HII